MISGLKEVIGFLVRSIRSQWRFHDVEIGFGTFIDRYCRFYGHNSVGEFSSLRGSALGRYTYVGSRVCVGKANIGAFCSIASDVKIGLCEHPTKGYVSTYPAFHIKWNLTPWGKPKICWDTQKNTVIGNDVWIGECAIIKAGVSVGDGAIIGAGAVVVKDVPEYAIVAGVPAKVIRYRLKEDQIKALEAIKWWEWDESKIARHVDEFCDIDRFVENAVE